MVKRVITILADGFEEMEALAPIDMLRRSGSHVVIAGLGGRRVVSSRGVAVEADEELSAKHLAASWDAIVLPGGMPGAENLHNSPLVNELIKKIYSHGGYVCAICASPAVVLAPTGILDGKTAVCYPGMEAGIDRVKFLEDKVLNTDRIITSRGAGCAVQFALEIVSALYGRDAAEDLSRKIVY